MSWRIGSHYGIHVYEGDRPVATFFDAADAKRAVDAVQQQDTAVRALLDAAEAAKTDAYLVAQGYEWVIVDFCLERARMLGAKS